MHGRRPTITSMHGVVAAAHPLAAQAGAKLLAAGGNAFDAAAATSAALNVVEPYMSSFGGMGLATCWIAAEKRLRVLDYVSKVPSKFPVERFRKRDDVMRGALAVGTPSNLAGWCELVRAHGRKPLSEIFAPAIAIARDGFPLIEFNVDEINEAGPQLRAHSALYEAWARNYTDGTGRVSPGFVLRQPDLARTYEALGAEGPGLLYGGALGRKIIDHLASLGGTLSMADLEAFKPEWKDPISAAYRQLVVHVPPPACEGFQYLLTLRILEGFDIAAMERNGVEHLDLVWRAIRLAAGVRIANNDPSPERLAELMSDAHVASLRKRVADKQPIAGPTEQWTEQAEPVMAGEHHTTSLSIADRDGNLICVTQSIGSVFGSGVVVPGTGVCLNNFLYWSDVNPKSPNHTRPGKALPICMAPSISTYDGKPCLALGTPGSYGILQTQPQALVQYVDYGLSIQDAIEAPRARLWDGRRVEVEGRIPQPVVDELRSRGHGVSALPAWHMRVGGMQGVALDQHTGAMTGGCDPRRDGYVATA
jgi:gamma-glutamyltranspeptidase/glutathione hydrolase